jgi:hypothetical protein
MWKHSISTMIEERLSVIFTGRRLTVPSSRTISRMESHVSTASGSSEATGGEGGMHMLFEEFVDYLHRRGFKGILVDATTIEGYMHQRHFLKRGFKILREIGDGKLLYYPISQQSVWVEPLQPHVTREGIAPVDILVIGSHFCPVAASAVLSLRKIAAELDGLVHLRELDANRSTIEHYGVADGIYINGKPAFFGPVNEATVRDAIRKEEYLIRSSRRSVTTPTISS